MHIERRVTEENGTQLLGAENILRQRINYPYAFFIMTEAAT